MKRSCFLPDAGGDMDESESQSVCTAIYPIDATVTYSHSLSFKLEKLSRQFLHFRALGASMY